MSRVPESFCREIAAHNRHAIGGAVAALLAALLAWGLYAFVFVLLVLGFLTSTRGDFGPHMPPWLPLSALGGAAALMLWALIDARRRRFSPVSNRSILGWHLIPDFLLLPARLTLAITGNLRAVRRLSPADEEEAWTLLCRIAEEGKSARSHLAGALHTPDRLDGLLQTLGLLGYIDAHPGGEDWFFTLCSPREAEIRALMKDC